MVKMTDTQVLMSQMVNIFQKNTLHYKGQDRRPLAVVHGNNNNLTPCSLSTDKLTPGQYKG